MCQKIKQLKEKNELLEEKLHRSTTRLEIREKVVTFLEIFILLRRQA